MKMGVAAIAVGAVLEVVAAAVLALRKAFEGAESWDCVGAVVVEVATVHHDEAAAA